MIASDSFINYLRSLGYSHYAGVPCSFLKPFINYVIDDPRVDYIGATSEGEAVGISFGAYLAGRKTVTMCQNSGLGNMVNPLTSLNYPFKVPTLLIVTWRGQPGIPDEPQHEQMGRITQKLLDTLEIPWLPFPAQENEVERIMTIAEERIAKTGQSFALVMPKNSVGSYQLKTVPLPSLIKTDYHNEFSANIDLDHCLSRTKVLELILEILQGDEAVISTTGKTGRELFTIADRPNHIYVVGGMGTASAIGLGVAHNLPHQTVVVIDGDGAALMKMGAFSTIGYYQPKNLLHIILDNQVHDSTGGQSTSAKVTQFAKVAAATNYRHSYAVDSKKDIIDGLKTLLSKSGPNMLHIKIHPGSPKNLGRPTVKPPEVKKRFMAFLSKQVKLKK